VIIFLTGGTGALGRPTVSLLLQHGHRVRALATNPDSASSLRSAGAEPVSGSLFDPATLAAAVTGADAILHLATRIAPTWTAWRRDAWRENDRIRAEGTRNLAECALAADVGVLVYPSFAPIYADGGARWLCHGAPIAPTDILESTVTAEEAVSRFTTAGGRGVVLRMAGVYGPHSAATRDVLDLGRRGISPFVGPAAAYQPLVWDEDAAAALVAAAEADVRGIYDIVDDEPLTRAQLGNALAAAVGRRTVRRPPTALVRLALGRRLEFFLRSQRISNRRFVEATGWTPRVGSAAKALRRLEPAGTVAHGGPPRSRRTPGGRRDPAAR